MPGLGTISAICMGPEYRLEHVVAAEPPYTSAQHALVLQLDEGVSNVGAVCSGAGSELTVAG